MHKQQNSVIDKTDVGTGDKKKNRRPYTGRYAGSLRKRD